MGVGGDLAAYFIISFVSFVGCAYYFYRRSQELNRLARNAPQQISVPPPLVQPYGQAQPQYGQPQPQYGQPQPQYGQPQPQYGQPQPQYVQPMPQPQPQYGQPTPGTELSVMPAPQYDAQGQPQPQYGQPQPQYGQPMTQPPPQYGQPMPQPQPQYGQPMPQPMPQPQPQYGQPQPQYGQPQVPTNQPFVPGTAPGYPAQPQPQYGQPQPQYGQPQPQYGQPQPQYGQPMPQYGQPVVQGVPVAAPVQQLKGWNTGVCDCFADWETCLCTTCCGVSMTAFVYNRTGMGGFVVLSLIFYAWLTIVTLGSYFNGGVIVILIIGWIFRTYFRAQLRKKYNLQGDLCCDCLLHFFCSCCATAQEARQVIHHERPEVIYYDSALCASLDPNAA